MTSRSKRGMYDQEENAESQPKSLDAIGKLKATKRQTCLTKCSQTNMATKRYDFHHDGESHTI